MSYVIMTDKEWVERMEYCARNPSNYANEFPYNLLYQGNGRKYADCHNLQKALFNGRDVYNATMGSYAWPLPATGDCTEYALLMQCSDIQWYNFKTLKEGEPRCLYMDGHFGAYLGKEWNEPGQGIVNCVESTPRWEDGIQFSYIAPDGGRYWCKGATRCGTWEAHGLASKWVEYTNDSTQAVVEESKKAVAEDITTTKYSTADLAVAFIRNKFGNGLQNRINNAAKYGYTELEVRKAQDLVNEIVKTANAQKAKAEEELTVITVAYDVIAGMYGDGYTRTASLENKFGYEIANKIRLKVEELLNPESQAEEPEDDNIEGAYTKEQAEGAFRNISVTRSEVVARAKEVGLDDDEITGLLGWVQGEGYWGVGDPYLGYLSACVIINCIFDGWYGRGHKVIERIASWGSYYSEAKQVERSQNISDAALKCTYMALTYLQTGIHCCYGPGEKPSNCFYDSGFKVDGKTIYVF